MNHLLEVEGLTVDYPIRRGVFTAIEDVSFHVSAGEILGVVGESGAGKSTVGAAIMRLIDYPGFIRSGKIVLSGLDLASLSDQEMTAARGRRIGMIFQDTLTALNPVLTIGAQIRETICTHTKLTGDAVEARAVELLTQVGIPEPKHRLAQYPHQFSGGMRQRVVIAIALAGEPELLVADEPTTALDVSIQSEILDLIRSLCRDRNLGVILITHDMAVINEVTDRVAVMLRGHIVEINKTRKIIDAPAHSYTQSLISAVPRTDVKLDRFKMVDATAGAESAVEGMGKEAAWLRAAASEQAEAAASPMIEVDNLTVRFIKSRGLLARWHTYFNAVDGVTLEVRRGETFGLVGESGSGKSTVAKTVVGLEPPYKGKVRYKGADISALSTAAGLRANCTDMQIIFQDPFSSLNPRMRVRQIISEPMVYHSLAEKSEACAFSDELLVRVGLDKAAGDKYPHQFSGGQRQRICIARALVMRPRMLICDEPTSALDVSIQASLLNLLKDLQEELGLTILFISHDLAVIRQMCDRVAVMRYGKLCEIADSETLFTDPQHPYTRELLRLAPKFRRQAAI